MAEKKRVLSGMRPTGRMHLGHVVGALDNWVRLQGEYECFFFVADWHALTTDYADTSGLRDSTFQMIVDWLAVGLDPGRATFFVQSWIPDHAELHLLLSMVTPLGWLERVPSYKEQRQNIRNKDLSNYGFLGYPVLQAADILIYRAHFVPVGEDQVAHVELTREIARRFNFHYGEVFPEPGALLTPVPKLAGLDGRKMSKSYDNVINLSDDGKTIEKKVAGMLTDPQRVRRDDPGRPEICPVFSYHQRYSAADTVRQVEADCRTAKIGCVDCKKKMLAGLLPVLEPIQQKRAEYESRPGDVWDILKQGTARAAGETALTMQKVREAMKMVPPPGEE